MSSPPPHCPGLIGQAPRSQARLKLAQRSFLRLGPENKHTINHCFGSASLTRGEFLIIWTETAGALQPISAWHMCVHMLDDVDAYHHCQKTRNVSLKW